MISEFIDLATAFDNNPNLPFSRLVLLAAESIDVFHGVGTLTLDTTFVVNGVATASLAATKAELTSALLRTDAEWQRATDEANETREQLVSARISRARTAKARLEQRLEEVNHWLALPTSEHEAVQAVGKLMIEELTRAHQRETRTADMEVPEPMTVQEFKTWYADNLKQRLAGDQQSCERQAANTAQSNAWLAALRQSLVHLPESQPQPATT